uniref:uncharacterized protein tp53i13 n=1 Tax=Centroberyx gerrardi TaxID=166262 RepID=UPI003AACF018
MRSQTTSPPLTVTLLAALWVSLGRCGGTGSPWPGCDNGKFSLERDLPQEAVWVCPVSSWPQSTQRLPSIDTVYDPEPARQVCLDKRISYSHTIPNSGAYRPVRAESGEYMYCPPQRWLNNLHHGATVLLYHPCAPLRERLLLSVLARSCLSDYILTPHPELREHTPVALVSWGRTLELSTVATADVCDWLETTTTTGTKHGDVRQTRKYNLLLTWPAEQHPSGEREQQRTPIEKHSPKTQGSVRRCCERTLFPLLDGGMEAELDSRRKKKSVKEIKEGRKRRQSRAASSPLTNQTNGTIPNGTDEVRKYITMSEPSADSLPGTRAAPEPTLRTDSPGSGKAPSAPQSDISTRPITPLGSNALEAKLAAEPLGSNTSEPKANAESQKHRQAPQPEPLRSGPEHPDLKHPDPSPGTNVLANTVSSEHTLTTRPETPRLDRGQAARPLSKGENAIEESTDVGKHRDKDSAKHNTTEKDSDKDLTVGKMKDNEVVDVKEREVERKHTHSNTRTHSKSKKAGFESASQTQSQPDPPPQPNHRHPQPASYLSNTHDCGDCDPDGHCDCTEASGAQGRGALLGKGMPRTPRTDEAVWAAAALGFLLVLLALSVLHTRLYRHWRTAPSLYWHDPRQDYDSVADVIRRRLRIARRRRKRGRRQECVLLPSSSSSDGDQ